MSSRSTKNSSLTRKAPQQQVSQLKPQHLPRMQILARKYPPVSRIHKRIQNCSQKIRLWNVRYWCPETLPRQPRRRLRALFLAPLNKTALKKALNHLIMNRDMKAKVSMIGSMTMQNNSTTIIIPWQKITLQLWIKSSFLPLCSILVKTSEIFRWLLITYPSSQSPSKSFHCWATYSSCQSSTLPLTTLKERSNKRLRNWQS